MNVKRLIAACAASLLAMPAVAAAAGWAPPRAIVKDRGTDPVSMHLAVDDSGNAAFVWFVGHSVRARVLTSAGRPGRTATLHRSRYRFIALPQIALGPHGRAAAIWEEDASAVPTSRWKVLAAVRSHGRFGPARLLGISRAYPYGGGGAGAEGDSPKVAVDRRGNTIFLWRRDDSSLQAVRRTAKGKFGRVQTILARSGSNPIGASEISLGFDDRGTAYAAWTSYNVLAPGGQVVSRSAGVRVAAWPRSKSRFARPETVSTPGEPASQPRMAVGAGGTVAVVWRHSAADDPAEASPGPIEAAVARGGAFSGPQQLDPACAGTHPEVAVARSGEAVVIWRQTCGTSGPLVGAGASPLSGSFGAVEPIYNGPADRTGAISATVAAGGSGQAVAAFSPDFTVSIRPSGGPFEPAHRIATAPDYTTVPRVAAGRRLAIVGWRSKGGFFYSTLRF